MRKQWKQCQTIFLGGGGGGSRITADGDCSHEIRRRGALGSWVLVTRAGKMNGRADFREPNAEVPRPIPHIGADYIPTEEERRVFAECNDQSFWFRSVPLAATSMLITQGLISKGILSSHPKYGSIPKLIFACIMGYFAGKLSYVKTCQEKFKNIENSPLVEALQSGQAQRSSPTGHYSQSQSWLESMFFESHAI